MIKSLFKQQKNNFSEQEFAIIENALENIDPFIDYKLQN
jgi:hypothetical protein